MDKNHSKTIVSLSKLLQIVNLFDLLVPLLGLFISLTLVLFDKVKEEYFQEIRLKHDEDFNAIKHVKELLTLACYYSFMIVKIGMTLLLWKGRVQRDLYKLKIWVVTSILLTLTGCCICFIAWLESVHHVGIVVAIMLILIIVSIFSILVVIYFVCKYSSGEIFDFDECMSLRFEPRENTVHQHQAQL